MLAGQHNDARMCIAIALTAARMGATVANHTDVEELLKTKDEDGNEVLCGAIVRDDITGSLTQYFFFIQKAHVSENLGLDKSKMI